MARRYRYSHRLPEPWRRVDIGGPPHGVERAAKRIMTLAAVDPKARFLITTSRIQGAGELWHNADFVGRHVALGQRIAELDPEDQYKIMARVTPETAALMAGRPDDARRIVLGPGADLVGDPAADFEMPAIEFDLPALNLEDLFGKP